MDEFDDRAIRETVARAVRRSCPRDLAAQADDVAQDVMVRLLERRKRADVEPARSMAYWRAAAYNGLMDELRRRRRRREDPLEEIEGAGGPGLPVANPQTDPERRAASRELARAIEDCLAGLTETRKVAVFLHLQGHTTPEAADILGWALKRAGSAIFRGMRDLRACLERKGFAP